MFYLTLIRILVGCINLACCMLVWCFQLALRVLVALGKALFKFVRWIARRIHRHLAERKAADSARA